MPRLYRPHIPLKVRCRVVMRQLGEMWPDEAMKTWQEAGGTFSVMLDNLLVRLCVLLDCDPKDLHLDHDPPIGARKIVTEGFRNGRHYQYYSPDANDPDHLIYREKQAHRIKTNVRGEHGQHPDRVLIKRERRRHKKKRRGPKIRSRGFDKRFTRKVSGKLVPRKRRKRWKAK